MTDETPARDAGPGGAAGTSRRALLVVAGAALPALLTACKGVQALGTPPPPPRDIRILRVAITAERRMLARYATAITQLTAGPPSVLAAVRAVQAEHAAHLSQLRSRLIEPAISPASSASRPSVAAEGGSVASVLAALGQAEQAASDRLLGELPGLPPALAQLFASVAASEATHVPFLTQAEAAAG